MRGVLDVMQAVQHSMCKSRLGVVISRRFSVAFLVVYLLKRGISCRVEAREKRRTREEEDAGRV